MSPPEDDDDRKLEQELVDRGPELSWRMRLAKEYQTKLLRHTIWANQLLAQNLDPNPHRWSPMIPERDLVERLRRDERFNKRPHVWGGTAYIRSSPPQLDPYQRPVSDPNAIFYASPGGHLQMTLWEAQNLGRLMFDVNWIRLLLTNPPMEHAHAMGINGRPGYGMMDLLEWLNDNTQYRVPDYLAACIDMYLAGVAIRKGYLVLESYRGLRPTVEWPTGPYGKPYDRKRSAPGASGKKTSWPSAPVSEHISASAGHPANWGQDGQGKTPSGKSEPVPANPKATIREKLKNWWTGGGFNSNADAENVRIVRTIEGFDPSVPEGLRGPERYIDYNKDGEIVGVRDVRGIADDSGSFMFLGGGAKLGKKLVTNAAKALAKKSSFAPGRGLDELLVAANKPVNQSGLSVSARAWEKHAGRPGGTFKPLSGTVAEKNAKASDFVESVLKNPDSVKSELSRGGVEFRLPAGQGVRYNGDGSFSGLLDPKR